MADALAPVVREFVAQEMDKRLNGLMRYCGVHQRAMSYQKGDAVTADGSLWIAVKDSDGGDCKPGSSAGAHAWQLVAKGR